MSVQADDGLARAYAACERFARDHYENFPVASRLVPLRIRPHIAAVYAFARIADDLADEGERDAGERLELLNAWLECLRAAEGEAKEAVRGEARAARPRCVRPGLPPESDAVFLALGNTLRACALPLSLFEDLLSAFRQDVTRSRYASWDEVLDYCRRSANPVGRIVLGIAGYRDERLNGSSDALCTALQLTNFWQDLERDWKKGRLYLPLDECGSAGADPADLVAGRMTPAWQQVLRSAAARTASLFDAGRVVCDGVRGRLGLELRLTWLGGRRVLERLEAGSFDVFTSRPALGPRDVPLLLWRTIGWRRRPLPPPAGVPGEAGHERIDVNT